MYEVSYRTFIFDHNFVNELSFIDNRASISMSTILGWSQKAYDFSPVNMTENFFI